MGRIVLCVAGVAAVMAMRCGCAQQAQAAPGPTMQQTIDFINETFTKQGEFTGGATTYKAQSVKLESECAVVLKLDTLFGRQSQQREEVRGLLRLQSSDISSISVRGKDSGVFAVSLERADFERRPAEVVSQRTLQFHAGETYSSDDYRVRGRLEPLRDGVVSMVTDEGVRISAPLDANTRAMEWVSKLTGGTERASRPISSFEPGDVVYLWPGSLEDKKGSPKIKNGRPIEDGSVEIMLFAKAEKGRRYQELGYFQDKDTAERVARAYVHAMALCHKDDKPSLF